MKNTHIKSRPALLEYLDIHLYLRDLYQFRKLTERDFSYESWASELGIKSRSFLRLVVLRKRTLTAPVFKTIIQKLKLSPDEVQYAHVLFQYSFTEEKGLKEIYGKELAKKWNAHVGSIVIEDLGTFLEDPLIPVVFTYFSYEKASSDISVIAKTLMSNDIQIQNAIVVLTKMGLLHSQLNDRQEICYKTKENHFKVPETPGLNFLKRFHLEGLDQARKAHDLPFEERKFRSLLLTLSQPQIALAEKLINDFAHAIFKQVELSDKDESAKVYRLNLQFFPISEKIG
ncbi:TIGR02147 family protein [Bdellovibrio sp. HCB337]|uniref:TIGR02147 family protein n=1 Tax=Bdellovibrio sp. HCB337 TaxID=3394358 RepID=UPI0039A466A8